MCGLFDFEEDQLREMFPLCPENVLAEAVKFSQLAADAVDYVMQNTGKTEGIKL